MDSRIIMLELQRLLELGPTYCDPIRLLGVIITTILVLFTTFGKGKPIEEYENEWYPIKVIQLLSDNEDGGDREWSLWTPKYLARSIMKLLDRNYLGLKVFWPSETIADEVYSMQDQDTWLELMRRWNIRPLTEVGPGAFKSDIVNYPPETLANDLKKLLALKKRQEDRAKDLNAGNENL